MNCFYTGTNIKNPERDRNLKSKKMNCDCNYYFCVLACILWTLIPVWIIMFVPNLKLYCFIRFSIFLPRPILWVLKRPRRRGTGWLFWCFRFYRHRILLYTGWTGLHDLYKKKKQLNTDKINEEHKFCTFWSNQKKKSS